MTGRQPSRTQATSRWAAALLALGALTACSADGAGRVSLADPTGSPSPTTTATGAATNEPAGPASTASPQTSPSASPSVRSGSFGPGVALAVTTEGGEVALYRVPPRERAAELVQVLRRPVPGAVARDVSLSAGERPAVCVVYRLPSPPATDDSSLVCHGPGQAEGRRVAAASYPTAVAVDAAGRRVTWAGSSLPSATQDLVVGSLRDGQVVEERSLPADPRRGPTDFVGYGIGHLAWVDPGRVAVSVGVESDDGPDVRVVDLSTSRGWYSGRQVRPSDADRRSGYVTYDRLVSDVTEVGDGALSAIAVERASWMDDVRVPARAVRVDLRDGRVEQVVAVAAVGRDVIAVSGGTHVLYVTRARDGSRLVVSLRWPGEDRGGPVTGLPADTETAVAQP